MYSPDGEEVTANNKEEHEEYSAKGYTHTKPVKEVEEPKAQGEKDFKAKHKVKKSGMNNDGTVTKEEVTITIDEAKRAGKGNAKVDIDWIGDRKLAGEVKKKYKVTVKPTGRSTADVSGKKEEIVKMMLDPNIMGWDQGDLEDLFPELFEGKEEGYEGEEDLSPKQKKYQAFFKKALKKFGVDSPEDLDKEKRKEFFDYIDKNWEGENESD